MLNTTFCIDIYNTVLYFVPNYNYALYYWRI
jgi:hypothetical protein